MSSPTVTPSVLYNDAASAETVRRHVHQAVAAGADIVRELHVSRTAAFPQGSAQFDVRDLPTQGRPLGRICHNGTYLLSGIILIYTLIAGLTPQRSDDVRMRLQRGH